MSKVRVVRQLGTQAENYEQFLWVDPTEKAWMGEMKQEM
jgi:hypothetical protein